MAILKPQRLLWKALSTIWQVISLILLVIVIDPNGEVVYSALDALNCLTGSYLVKFVQTIDVFGLLLHIVCCLLLDGKGCSYLFEE